MGKFNFIHTALEGAMIIEPQVFGDSRGFFMETFSVRDYAQGGIKECFVQENQSRSSRGVLRGMHFQKRQIQGKLIRVTAGSVYDVIVDMRAESPTLGRWIGVELSAENKRQLYVPPRFAHGFLTLEDNTDFAYKCTDYYAPQWDGGVRWNDPSIDIDWQFDHYGIDAKSLIISDKDQKQPLLTEIDIKNLFTEE